MILCRVQKSIRSDHLVLFSYFMPGPLIAYTLCESPAARHRLNHGIFCGAFNLGRRGAGVGNFDPFRRYGPAPFCTGGKMKDWARPLYYSAAWKNIRGYVFHRDQMLCQDCLKKGIYTPAEEVHHIVELTPSNVSDPNIALNADNLISLCRSCHKSRHESKPARRYTIDEMGRVTIK